MTILLAVQAFGGRLGGGRLSQILAGARRPEITRCGYDRDPFFGSLKSLSQNNILLFMKALEAANYLKRVGNPEYPCLGLSTLGTDMLRGKKTLSLAIPELKSAEPERTKREKKKVISARGEIRERVLYGICASFVRNLLQRNGFRLTVSCRTPHCASLPKNVRFPFPKRL